MKREPETPPAETVVLTVERARSEMGLAALTSGDDDPRSPAALTAAPIPVVLGPGDDDPRSPARHVDQPAIETAPPADVLPAVIIAAPGPGDAVGPNPDEAFHFLAPPPAGPGGTASVRQLVRIPKQVDPVPAPPEAVKEQTERG